MSKCQMSDIGCPVMRSRLFLPSYSILVVRTLHELLETINWWRHRTDEDQRGAEITHIEYTGRRDHAQSSAALTAGREATIAPEGGDSEEDYPGLGERA